ncbi:MAG: hypothetical protein RR555_09220 [Bacteroidales bacterium]
MKTLDFNQMEQIEGGGWLGFGCSMFMTGWGGVLAYGASAAALTGGASLAITLVWGAISAGVCTAVDR